MIKNINVRIPTHTAKSCSEKLNINRAKRPVTKKAITICDPLYNKPEPEIDAVSPKNRWAKTAFGSNW